MNTEDLLGPLTEAQREAVQHVDGPLLILAGPGSGKTRVITHRIAYLLSRGVPAGQILALTFTNKAAEEMQSRLERLVPGQTVWMGTFHRFCARLLRRYASLVGLEPNFTIYDTQDSRRVLVGAVRQQRFDSAMASPDCLAAVISNAKNNMVTAARYEPRPGDPLGPILSLVYPAYQRALLLANAVDFDDLLLHTVMLLSENPEIRHKLDDQYRYLLVDEYQDTNRAQYAIVRAMSLDYPNLAVTGDPDQSIYSWRGANLGNILEFERDYPQVRIVRLEQNYRSTKHILRAAAKLIACNRRRKEKALFTHNADGVPVGLLQYLTETDEAEGIARRIARQVEEGRRRYCDFAVFYRVNALSRALEEGFRRMRVPYQVVSGQEFYQRQEIKDVMAYLCLLNNPRDNAALLRVLNVPTRGIGKATVDRLSAWAAENGQSLLEACRQSGLIETIPKRTAVAVARFVSMYDKLSLLADRPVTTILNAVFEETGYRRMYGDSEQDQQRLENIDELLTAAQDFDRRHRGDGSPLEDFLENVSLVNETDNLDNKSTDRVVLMTLHAAKGLEFPVVFITALEDGLLPHENNRRQEDLLEEERRLLFVGMTRAREELFLTRTMRRTFRGSQRTTVPSSFLMELPRDEMEKQFQDQPQEATTYVPGEESQVSPFDESAPAARPSRPAAPPKAIPARLPQLMTAAQLANRQGEESSAPAELPLLAPEDVSENMWVMHPEYGLGVVKSLSGSGDNRIAAVEFLAENQVKSFVLRHAALRLFAGQ